MHELTNIENLLNMTGIILEIVGFALLLSKLRVWIRNRYAKNLTAKAQEAEGAYTGPPNRTIDNATKKTWKHIENLAIPLVIFGLFFQGLAIFLHS